MLPYAIDRIVSLVRQNTNEPATKAKFSDDELLVRIETSFREVIAEINISDDARIIVRHPITPEDGDEVFLLPPNVETVIALPDRSIDSYHSLAYEVEPLPMQGWGGPGLRLEGRLLRFEPAWQGEAASLWVMYVPNGDFLLHYGTLEAVVSSTEVSLGAIPTKGSLDTRENAYVGGVLRIITATSGNYVQEMTITAYDRMTRVATLEPALDPLPSGVVTYEIVPLYWKSLEPVVAWSVAKDVAAAAPSSPRYSLATSQYRQSLRLARMSLGRKQGITGRSFSGMSRVVR